MKAAIDSVIDSHRSPAVRSSRSATARRAAGARPTTAEKVEAAIIQDIRQQVYAPGASLREERMSARYGVSRTIIRTVLVRLASEGYVELHPWRGAYITRYSYDELADLLDLHILLMSFVARRAAVRRSPEDLARLDAILGRLQTLCGEQDCSAFHVSRIALLEALMESSSPLDRALRRSAMTTAFYHQHWVADIASGPARQRQLVLYRDLLAALAGRDPCAAAERITAILRETRRAVLAAEKGALG